MTVTAKAPIVTVFFIKFLHWLASLFSSHFEPHKSKRFYDSEDLNKSGVCLSFRSLVRDSPGAN